MVTIPEKNIPSLPAGLFADTPDHVVVVNTGNDYPRQRDDRVEAIETGLPESQWVPLRTSCRALIPVMLWAHWHCMLVVQHWPATPSLLCRLAVVTWLAEPLPIMAVPEEPEISTVRFDVIDMLGETGTLHVLAELRTRWVAFEETSCCLLPPDCVTTLACRWAFVTSRHKNPATNHWNYTLNPRNYSLFDHRLGGHPLTR